MDVSKIEEKIHSLLYSNLKLKSPVLSGNMKAHIKKNGDREIVIEAPFYDMKEYRKTGVIIHTGKVIYGKKDYAEWVNELGAFAKHNKSEHWVNRTILDVARVIANEIGAEIINELQL